MSQGKYSIGLDFGTNSARTVIVDVSTGEEIATSVWEYTRGEAGILLDPKDPNLARQHPAEYVDGIEKTVKDTLAQAAGRKGFSPENVIGIGVDTTGSTPIPVDDTGEPLAFRDEFSDNLAAMAWLWKDHTGHAEAAEITELAAKMRPEYLTKCGGTYSSEWLWSKALHCLRVAPKVFDAAYTWVECADWIPAFLTDTSTPSVLKRGICAAGHKAMFNPGWNGYPDEEFAGALDKKLVRLRKTLRGHTRCRGCVRRASGRCGFRHKTGHPSQDHRHVDVRYDGVAAVTGPARYPRFMRHRARIDPAGVLRS